MSSAAAKIMIVILCFAAGGAALAVVIATGTTQRQKEGEANLQHGREGSPEPVSRKEAGEAREEREVEKERPADKIAAMIRKKPAKEQAGAEGKQDIPLAGEQEEADGPVSQEESEKTLSDEEQDCEEESERRRPGEPPFLKPEEIPKNVKLALSKEAPDKERFYAIWGLAISGYTEESAEALTVVACDSSMGSTTRGYAAMGLRNFTRYLPEASKDWIAGRLRETLEEEVEETPDGIIRTLLGWGYASFVREIMGEDLEGHGMEIEVLAALTDEESADKLWQLYLSCPENQKTNYYPRKARIGRALADRGDKRGIDILMGLLREGGAPSRQYRSNTYYYLTLKIGRDFGYSSTNYSPALEEAVPKMLSWWDENRESFTLPSGGDK